MKKRNYILNQDWTRKNSVLVDEATARSDDCPVDILPDDIFVVGAPDIPDGMIKPRLAVDWKEQIEAAKLAGLPKPEVWEETAPQSELDAIQAEQALSQCIAQRKARYVEVDALRAEITMDALIDGIEPDYSPAVTLYQQIKAEIPKP